MWQDSFAPRTGSSSWSQTRGTSTVPPSWGAGGWKGDLSWTGLVEAYVGLDRQLQFCGSGNGYLVDSILKHFCSSILL